MKWTKTELYLGQDMPGGKKVGQKEWADFLNNAITKQFPKGLTVFEAYGQMQHENGMIEKQSTRIVEIVHPQDPAIEKTIQEIIKAYRETFKGAQVMHLSSPVQPEFFAD